MVVFDSALHLSGSIKETVNQRIARYRKLKGFTQARLAEEIGMRPSSYSQMERCGNITTQRLVDIAIALKVDANVLLYGEVEILPPPTEDPKEPIGEPSPPLPPLPPEDDLILSNLEKNLVKIYRSLPKEVKKEIDIIVNEKYQMIRNKKK